MNYSKLLICLLFILPKIFYAQTQHWGRTYDDKLPDAFKIETAELRSQVYDGIPQNIRTGVFDRKVFQFSDETAMSVSNLIQSGDVYSDWQAFEDYVNKVFQKVIPDELKDDKGIHAYIVKEGRYNAFMTPTGMAFIHIGLFAEIYDEASLAAILAHELAHYHLRHSLNRFIKAQQGEFRAGLFKNDRLASDYSISNELQADSLAVVWLSQSGYNINGIRKAFKVGEAIEENILMRSTKWELKATTHPLSEDRLSQLDDYIEQFPEVKGEDFLIGKEDFELYSKEAKVEILKHSLEDFDFDFCIEQAFRFHIFDTKNPVYVYYAMEAIRRMCYLEPNLWQRNFITYRYFDVLNGDNETERKKVPMTDHLFKKLPKKILRISAKDVSKIQAKFYWKEVKFTTNEQAFEFLYKISQMVKDNESVLTYALSVTNSDKIRNKFLTEYIERGDVKYKEYAENLLKGTLRDNLKSQKLTVFSDFQVRIRQRKSDVRIRKKELNGVNQEKELLKNVLTEFEDRTPLFLSDLKNDRLNDYRALNELEEFSFIQLVSQRQKMELDIFSPDYWQLMKRFDVHEIEFVNCFYLNIATDKKTLDSYKEGIEKDMKSIMTLEKQTKFFDTFITSVRIIKDGRMKIRYYDGEKRLKVKQPGYDQVENWIKIFLKEKDAVARQLDIQYKNQ